MPTDHKISSVCAGPFRAAAGDNKRRRKNVLVTGGAGFVGSHLCETLLARGRRVICLDNFDTGRHANIAHLMTDPNFVLVEADVTGSLDFDVQEIYNLASPASPPHYQADPIRTTKTNVLGGLNVLELAVRTKARVFQASTSEVYGDPDVHPQPESYWGNVNSYGPRACYDEGKRCVESLCFDFARVHGVDVRIARIFNTYGPRMCIDDGRVVSNFLVQALRNEAITIYGEGSQTRSFCYIDDLVDGIGRLMALEVPPSSPVNLGNPGEYSVVELAELVIAMTGSKARLVRLPCPTDDPKRRKPDISLAKSLLGWEPKVPLRTGLKKTTEYFEKCLERGLSPLAAAE